jgi:hypothetical protein
MADDITWTIIGSKLDGKHRFVSLRIVRSAVDTDAG